MWCPWKLFESQKVPDKLLLSTHIQYNKNILYISSDSNTMYQADYLDLGHFNFLQEKDMS